MKSRDSFIPRLVVIEGNDKGKVIPLKDGTIVIGRSKGDILIHDPRISRSHVALHFDEKKGRLSFTDLKSLNGILHNGDTQESGDLLDGDKLQLGNTTFDCQIAREGNDATVNGTHPSAQLKESTQAGKASDQKRPTPKKPKIKKGKTEDDLELVPLLNDQNDLIVKNDDEPAKDFGGVTSKWKSTQKRTKLIAVGSAVVILVLVFSLKGKKTGDLSSELTLARSLASQGKVAQADSKAEEISREFKETSESFMLLGDLYSQQGRNEQALTNYRRAHELPPAQPMVHLRLIRIFLRAGLTKEAENELKHVDEIIKKEGTPSKELFIETAEIFLEFKELKQPPEKLYILSKALQNAIAPGNKVGYKLEAQSYQLQNRNQEAVEVLNTLLKMDPKDEWIYENLAFCKLSLSDLPGAVATVESWLKIWPESTKALLVMSYLKFNDEQLADAEPLVRKVIDLLTGSPTDPHYAESLHLLGQIYIRTNRSAEGSGFLRQSCELGFTQSCTAMNDAGGGANRKAATSTENPNEVVPAPESTGSEPPQGAAPNSATPPGLPVRPPSQQPGE